MKFNIPSLKNKINRFEKQNPGKELTVFLDKSDSELINPKPLNSETPDTAFTTMLKKPVCYIANVDLDILVTLRGNSKDEFYEVLEYNKAGAMDILWDMEIIDEGTSFKSLVPIQFPSSGLSDNFGVTDLNLLNRLSAEQADFFMRKLGEALNFGGRLMYISPSYNVASDGAQAILYTKGIPKVSSDALSELLDNVNEFMGRDVLKTLFFDGIYWQQHKEYPRDTFPNKNMPYNRWSRAFFNDLIYIILCGIALKENTGFTKGEDYKLIAKTLDLMEFVPYATEKNLVALHSE